MNNMKTSLFVWPWDWHAMRLATSQTQGWEMVAIHAGHIIGIAHTNNDNRHQQTYAILKYL